MEIDGDFNGDGIVDGADPDDAEEHTSPGLLVRLNDNDSNSNGIIDKDEVVVSGENDLVKIHLGMLPDDVDSGIVILAAPAVVGGGEIKIWSSPTKGAGNLILDSTQVPYGKKTWTLSSGQTFGDIAGDLYVEGTEASSVNGGISLILRYDNPDGTIQSTDELVLTVTRAELDIGETARPANRIGWDDPRMLDNIRNKIVVWSTDYAANKTQYDLLQYSKTNSVFYKIDDAQNWNSGYPLEDVLNTPSNTITAVHGADYNDWDFRVSYGGSAGGREDVGPYEIYAVSEEDYDDAGFVVAGAIAGALDDWADAVYKRFRDGNWNDSDSKWHPTSTNTTVSFIAEQPLENVPYADMTHKFGATFTNQAPILINGRRYPQTLATVPVYYWSTAKVEVVKTFLGDPRVEEVIKAFLEQIPYDELHAYYTASSFTGTVRLLQWEFSREESHQLYWVNPEDTEVPSMTGGNDTLLRSIWTAPFSHDALALGDVWVVGSDPSRQLYGGGGHIELNVEKLPSGDLKIHALPNVNMTVEDMFDFNYFNGFGPKAAARIQCAHGRKGTKIGQAALLRFDVQGTVKNIGDIIIAKP